MTAALPALLSAGLPGLRLKSEARHMVDALREAHALAVKSTTELTLTIDSEGSRYTITPAAEPTTLPTGVTLRFRDIPYAETKGAIAHIRFFPDSSSTGGTVGLLQGGQQYWIGVNWLTGRVSLRD
jgi:general secretion pathway protein H